MAIMIPSVISPEVTSTAEKRIFSWFQNAPGTDNWVILHSLGISNHRSVIHGEVDFFVLVPDKGIFALEVKGGRVRRENGIWYFTNRYGKTNSKRRGPFDQAWEAIYSIKDSLYKKVDREHGHLKNLVFGIGVMFPDIEYDPAGVDEEPWQVFDKRDGQNVQSYIERLAEESKKVWAEKKGEPSRYNFPSEEDVYYLADLLRGDFDLVPLLSTQMDYLDEELGSLTKEQYKCLDQLDDNPRCLVRGAAGTGKTLLAIEAAKKATANGEKVGLFCYNRLLGEWLKNYFKEQPTELRPAYVGTLHTYMMKVLTIDGSQTCRSSEEEKENYFRIVLPARAKEKLHGNTDKFDRLIIDEAQDILTDEYMDFLDSCLSRGLSRGKWMMFGDLSMQAIFVNGNSETDLIEMLENRTSFARFRLSTNCRNTKKICEEVRTITGAYEISEYQKVIDGPPVQYNTYTDDEDQRIRLETILSELSANNVDPGDITILSPRVYGRSVVSLLRGIDVEAFSIPKPLKTTFSTIQGFKGLENKVIIMTDIDSFKDKKLMYVGLSRARTVLYLLETETAKQEYTELFITRRL